MKHFFFRNGIRTGLLLSAFILLVAGQTARGVVLNLLDGNSTLTIDLTPGAQLGLIDWVIDGVNLLPPIAGPAINDYR